MNRSLVMRWLLLSTMLLLNSAAQARDIGLFIFLDDCDDLERMLVEDELDDEDFAWLMSLCDRPMSLNRISKEILRASWNDRTLSRSRRAAQNQGWEV